ncbi:MAG: hypothetical protein HN576_02585 [Bacteriovoracaceae bacterium]|jgi:hypothetical protein|nr:hypothetical protein [Bacteriovoracaceae bacterium]
MKKIIAITVMMFSSVVYSQGLTARATGVDAGGTSGRILSIESGSSLRSIEVRAIHRRLGLDSGTDRSTSRMLPTISVNLNNISELTLDDGTVLNKVEIKDLLKDSIRKD